MEHLTTQEDGQEYVNILRHLLRRYAGEYPAIAEITGINVRWIRAFSQGSFPDPGIQYLAPLAYALGVTLAVTSKQQGAAKKLIKSV